MCKEFDDSRKKLADLVFKMREFTEEELEKRFEAIADGKTEIGGFQTIHDFLDDLRELEVLRFKSGRYTVQNLKPVFA